jgi:hypothetical protein
MRVETSAGSYFIDWQHRVCTGNISHTTICWIKNEKLEEVNVDQTFCSIKDNFCKEKGRKISLARAIEEFDKPVRTEIWKAYLNRKVKDGINN